MTQLLEKQGTHKDEEDANENVSLMDAKDKRNGTAAFFFLHKGYRWFHLKANLLPYGGAAALTALIMTLLLTLLYISVSSQRGTPAVNQPKNLANACLVLKENGICTCWNPLSPRPRGERSRRHKVSENFNRSFKHNVYLAEQARDLKDVVFYGDSITEGWMGTVYRVVKNQEKANVYREFFAKNEQGGNGKFDGLALGVAGDQSANLLWRLQAGELPPTLQSKVFWVLIGTNDLAHSECYDDAVYMGIIGVVEYIQQQRPGSIIVVNSLLPRRDATLVDEVKFYDTHKISNVNEVPQFKIWKSVKNVNQKLRQYCEQNKRNKKVVFFDATDIFLKKDDSGVEYIPRNLMWDFLHPSVAGYRAWAEKITDVLSELLEEKDQSEMTTAKEKSVMKEADENQ